MKLLLIYLLSLTVSFAATPYVVKGTTLYEEGSEVGITSSVFISNSSVNSDGEVSSFSDDEKYMQMDVDIFGHYGFTNNLEIFLGTTIRSNSSSQLLSDKTYPFTATGIKSGWGGVKYSFPLQGTKALSLKFLFERNLFSNSEYKSFEEPDHIVLGDAGDEMSAGIAYSYFTVSQNFFSMEMTFRSPGSELSSEVLFSPEAGLTWKSFALYAGVDYNYSLKQDAYTEKPEDKPLISNGNTNLYNGVNRSWLEPYVGMGIRLGDKWRVEAKYSQRSSGISTDLGQQLTLSLVSRKSKSKAADLKRAAFKEYSVEGEVIKISKSLKTVVIDKGLIDDITKGDKVDFYYFDYLDGNELIASGFVVKVGSNKSLVKITKKYSKRAVKTGSIARTGLIK